MKTFVLRSLVAFILAVGLPAPIASASSVQIAEPLQILVRFAGDVPAVLAEDVLSKADLEAIELIPEIDVWVTRPKQITTAENVEKKLKSLTDRILYVEPSYVVNAIATPNDPLYPQQSEFGRIFVDRAWDYTIGSSQVIVAVTDTGIARDHVDLAANMWKNTREIPGNGIDDDGNGYIDDVNGWNFFDNSSDSYDRNRHGTHVSGIIGAEGNNGVGVAGVNWRTRLMAVQFLGVGGSGSTVGGSKAILYATKNGARIVNASWGGGAFSSALKDAIDYAYKSGTLVFAAAGNDGKDTDKSSNYPATYDSLGVIAVASSAAKATLSGFSSYGNISVDLVAPGSNILSTLLNNNWGRLSGTSMATPAVAGIAALILSQAPDLSAKDLRNAVLNAVTEETNYLNKVSTSGEVNAKAAIEQLSGGFQIWPSRLTLPVKVSYPFTAYGASGEVKWSAAPPNLATIDANGVLTAKNVGTVQVTAVDATGTHVFTKWVKIVKKNGASFSACTQNQLEMNSWEQETGAALSFSLPIVAGVAVRRRRWRALRIG
jgi:subtilisin family serine protease